MLRIKHPRDVIHRKALMAELESIAASANGKPRRTDLLDCLKTALGEGRDLLRGRFEAAEIDGMALVHSNAYLIDQLIRGIFDYTLRHVYPMVNPTKGEQLSVAAVGGYGRGELAPQSDVDLLFLLPYKQTPHSEQVIEYMLYMLWDMGLKVGHASRSIGDCLKLARQDVTIRTALLDARDLWGDEALFKAFRKRFHSDVIQGSGIDFVEAKMTERGNRHDRMGDARYVVEPNVKDGKGGLRDLQTLVWLIKYLYGKESFNDLVKADLLSATDARAFEKAFRFLWTVRCHLHYICGRPEERLTFDVQREIGARMGYRDRAGVSGVERFMKHYLLTTKQVGDLTRIISANLEAQQRKRRPFLKVAGFAFSKRVTNDFRVEGGRLAVQNDSVFERDPVNFLRLFHAAQDMELDIHPQALRAVTLNLKRIDAKACANLAANRLFLDILTSRKDPEMALRRMSEAGVFGRFVPDFGRVVAQMQYDMYHVYTVDEHTIRAIGILSRIENGDLKEDHPTAHQVMQEIQSRRALYVAVLLHDIAKGRDGDHSELGAKVARKLCPRFGLTAEETETVAWLVLHHLSMSRTAFKRDIHDPKTVGDFVSLVKSPERLRMLLVLTEADIRGVGPGVWNTWKAGLLRDLYYDTLEAIYGGIPAARRQERVKRAIARVRERLADWSAEDLEHFLALGYPNYWLSVDTETLCHHAELIRGARARGVPLHIETRIQSDKGATEIIVYTTDHPGLFSQITGGLSLAGVSVVAAKIFTLSDGMALDTFLVVRANDGPIVEPTELQRMWTRLTAALEGRVHVARELAALRDSALPSRTRVFEVTPRVLIDNKASHDHTVIEINGRDRVGLLYDITAALTALNLQIARAHISTYGEQVVDVFYIKDLFGLKVDNEARIARIRQALETAIAPPVPTVRKAAP